MKEGKDNQKPQFTFTPTQDLKLLWTKHYYPQASWSEIANILKTQFQLQISEQLLRLRYEEYLNVPSVRIKAFSDESKEQKYKFMEGKRKTPEEFLSVYREIKKYHETASNTKREEAYERDIIKKELYSDFEATITSFQTQSAARMKVKSLQEEYELLRYKQTSDLTEEEADKLQKIEKIRFKMRQMRLENHRNISKLYRVIRGIIELESKHFANQIILNEVNIGKYFLKVIRSIYQNVNALVSEVPSINFKIMSFENIERAYQEEGEKIFRKDIIKLYYFPNDKSTDEKQFSTRDGEKITEKRLILIMKMFKKIEMSYLKDNQATEKAIIAQMSEMQQFNHSSISNVKSKPKLTTIPLNNSNIHTNQMNKKDAFQPQISVSSKYLNQQRKEGIKRQANYDEMFLKEENLQKLNRQRRRMNMADNNSGRGMSDRLSKLSRDKQSQSVSPITKLYNLDLPEKKPIEPPRHFPRPSQSTFLLPGEPRYMAINKTKQNYIRDPRQPKERKQTKQSRQPKVNAAANKPVHRSNKKSPMSTTVQSQFEVPFKSPFDDHDEPTQSYPMFINGSSVPEKKKRGRKPKQKEDDYPMPDSAIKKRGKQSIIKEPNSKIIGSNQTSASHNISNNDRPNKRSQLQQMIDAQMMGPNQSKPIEMNKKSSALWNVNSKYKH